MSKSMLSAWTMGAMASKKLRDSSPVAFRMASARAGEVRGPVATMTLSQSSGGRPAISSRDDGDQRMGLKPGGHGGGKAFAVHGQGAAGRHLMGVAAGHDDRIQRPHLGVQQTHRIELPVVGPEGVGADQFGQAVGVVGVGLDARDAAHLVQDDGHAGLGDLPGGLGAGQGRRR